MRRLAPRAAAALVLSGLGFGVTQCGSDATGIEACRRIETRRCELALGCPEFPDVTSENDVTECKLIYEDQCDFGIAQGQDPDDLAVDLCLQALEEASLCRDQDLASCPEAPSLNSIMLQSGGDNVFSPTDIPVEPGLINGCSVIKAPQFLTACWFLAPIPESFLTSGGGDDGQGGAGGAGVGGGGGAGGA